MNPFMWELFLSDLKSLYVTGIRLQWFSAYSVTFPGHQAVTRRCLEASYPSTHRSAFVRSDSIQVEADHVFEEVGGKIKGQKLLFC